VFYSEFVTVTKKVPICILTSLNI